MADNDESIKVLLERIAGEIKLGEERLSGKLEQTTYLREKEALKTEFYTALDKVNSRITGLYIKIAGFSTVFVGILEWIFRNS